MFSPRSNVYPIESNVFDVLSVSYGSSPRPRSPIPPTVMINLKGVSALESDVFDVVSFISGDSGGSHCPVPCPPLKINPKGVYPME